MYVICTCVPDDVMLRTCIESVSRNLPNQSSAARNIEYGSLNTK